MRIRTLLLAVPAAMALLAAPAAHADWRGQGGWGGYRPAPHYGPQYGYYHGGGGGPVVAGALLGLGLGAVIAGVMAPPVVYPPPVVYAPPPVMYAPPPAVIYAPPPGTYGRW